MVKILRNTPCVYFISDGCGHCKIGVASDIHNRFNTLQVGSAYELKIKEIIYTDTLKEAYETETQYHVLLKDKHVRGEWFDEESVENVLGGKTINGDKKPSIVDFCEPGQFNFCDLINFYLLGIECCKNPEQFYTRYEEETPDYLKKALHEHYKQKEQAG